MCLDILHLLTISLYTLEALQNAIFNIYCFICVYSTKVLIQTKTFHGDLKKEDTKIHSPMHQYQLQKK